MKWQQAFLAIFLSYLSVILADDDCKRPNCAAVLCLKPNCTNGIVFVPPGQCCATCLDCKDCWQERNCGDVICEDVCCKFGRYACPCDCCPKCV